MDEHKRLQEEIAELRLFAEYSLVRELRESYRQQADKLEEKARALASGQSGAPPSQDH